MALAQSLLVQARYTEVITLAQQACADGDPPSAVNAEYMWGLALSHESRDLVEAGNHLRRASALLRQHPPTKSETEAAPFSTVSDTQITFELGNVLAQQGDLRGAIQCSRDVLASVQQTDQFDILNMQILAHNNLAYHLHLLNDPTAVEHARIALNLASEQGLIGMMTFIHSTLGELAMAQHDLTAAEAHFNQGLDLARRFNAPERITGLTANMGLLTAERGQTTLAIHHLSTALAQADTLGIRFLATRIRLWLAPLLPPAEAQMTLAEARSLADSSGYQQLLTEAKALTNQLHQVNRQSQA
jgi:tetratricopeptide (TPR) repeat protein